MDKALWTRYSANTKGKPPAVVFLQVPPQGAVQADPVHGGAWILVLLVQIPMGFTRNIEKNRN